MPNPNNPDEAECQTCFDSGYVPGTNRLCKCAEWPALDMEDQAQRRTDIIGFRDGSPIRRHPFSLEDLRPDSVGPTQEEFCRAKNILSTPDVRWAIRVMMQVDQATPR